MLQQQRIASRCYYYCHHHDCPLCYETYKDAFGTSLVFNDGQENRGCARLNPTLGPCPDGCQLPAHQDALSCQGLPSGKARRAAISAWYGGGLPHRWCWSTSRNRRSSSGCSSSSSSSSSSSRSSSSSSSSGSSRLVVVVVVVL